MYKEKRDTETKYNSDGTVEVTVKESTQTIVKKLEEPDYIKIYTKMWCDFNQIPISEQKFFLELVMRMTYANTNDREGGQLVCTGGPTMAAICETLNIKPNMYQKHLKALCDCGAIRRVAKGFYQINPQYAGKGEWKYNPRLERGGIEDIIAKFNFKDGTVDTNIVWADDGTESLFNQMYRSGLQVAAKDNTVLKSVGVQQEPQLDGQMEIDNIDMDLREVTNG